MLPFKWNWKKSAQTATLLNGIREEPQSPILILTGAPTFLTRDFFWFCSVPLKKFCRLMCQRNAAVINVSNRYSSLKFKFIVVFIHAFHWSPFSLQFKSHHTLLWSIYTILKPKPRSFLGVFKLLWYLCFLLIYVHSIWSTHLIYFTTWDYWLKNTDPKGHS